jgi:trehalose synthase
MIKIIEVKEGVQLKDYNLYSSLTTQVLELQEEAALLVPQIKQRKVWMINSTDKGGGVAEMMPRLISLLRQLGVDAEWVVVSTDNRDFFNLTKKLHNLIHGEKCEPITQEEKNLYENVNKDNAEQLCKIINHDDIIIIHDPQPIGMIGFMKQKINAKFIWRCHIGLDTSSDFANLAWDFLQPYAEQFSVSVFSSAEYIPSFLIGKAIIMQPTIDPLDHKNRELSIHKVVGILCNSNLVTEYNPVFTPPFAETVKRLQPDGTFQSPLVPTDIGLLFRPLVVQISRWDRLKGFLSLMKGFVELKDNMSTYSNHSARNVRRLEMVHLVLAGPDPNFVNDDPEGNEVLSELSQYYLSLPPSIQQYISILKLPMSSRKNNELIVNALQRVASVIVQNSSKEGFGLTVTEAMWKSKPVIGTTTCGIKQQIQDNLDGLLIENTFSEKEIASKLSYALERPKEREVWGYYAQKKVIENFLIFSQIKNWLKLFITLK